jgi:hypothetical protein
LLFITCNEMSSVFWLTAGHFAANDIRHLITKNQFSRKFGSSLSKKY